MARMLSMEVHVQVLSRQEFSILEYFDLCGQHVDSPADIDFLDQDCRYKSAAMLGWDLSTLPGFEGGNTACEIMCLPLRYGGGVP